MTFQTDGLTVPELDRHLTGQTVSRIVLPLREQEALNLQAVRMMRHEEPDQRPPLGVTVRGFIHPETGAEIPLECDPEQEPGLVRLLD